MEPIRRWGYRSTRLLTQPNIDTIVSKACLDVLERSRRFVERFYVYDENDENNEDKENKEDEEDTRKQR